MAAEKCILINEPISSCPMLIINRNPIRLCTSVESASYYCQYIYQLSHELTHYAIRQGKIDKNITIKWFEETLCEAMSLYILDLSAQRWDECGLSNNNPNYFRSILEYLKKEYNREGNSMVNSCKTLNDLKYIESTSESERANRILERNYLYKTFKDMPKDIKNIIYYTQYLHGIMVNFDKWKEEIGDENIIFLKKLEGIQPAI
ncbi:hypothetical protein [Tissierella sp. P1]|uniref:hypothetical protein n=1 Tax=Tissierella sp. P1 TaxID=1280483 RepID=UPI0011811134|nr:hypothetical protein [Tissierella sp. P1]